MKTENPYLEKKRQLIRAIDTQKSRNNLKEVLRLEHELEVLKAKERALWDKKIEELSDKIEKVKQEVSKIPEHRTKTQQIQEIIRLKRVVQGQFKDGVLIQKGIIQELREMGKRLRK